MQDYVQQVVLTESPIRPELLQRLTADNSGPTCHSFPRLLHGVMGAETKVGEMMDQLKKHVFYGEPVDVINIVEEIGDLLWYVAILCDELRVDLDDVMRKNIAKLRARYPERFSEYDAVNRNLAREREILEGGVNA